MYQKVNDINAVKVDLEDDGRVIIYHTDKDVIKKLDDENNIDISIVDTCLKFSKL